MKESDSTRDRAWRTVTHPDAARLLTDAFARRVLEPFVHSDMHSDDNDKDDNKGDTLLRDAARALGLKLNAMHYRAERLMRLGLIEVSREVPRAGRTLKRYRATAHTFFVPFEATPYGTLEVFLRQLGSLDHFIKGVAATLAARSSRWGVLVGPDEAGAPLTAHLAPLDAAGVPTPFSLSDILGADYPALWVSEARLRLDFGTAKRLQADLAALIERYEGESRREAQEYFVLLGITPLDRSRSNC